MEDDNITWESDSEEHEYHKWDYRHPEFFEQDPFELDKEYGNGYIFDGIRDKLIPVLKLFQSHLSKINFWHKNGPSKPIE